MYYTYILKCSDESLYVGATNDIDKRLHEHNFRKNAAHYTKIRRPVTLVYKETFITLKESRSREAALKRLSRHEKLEIISKSKDAITTMSLFQQKVLDVVRDIKAGSVMTYAEVALHAGNRNASRAVGTYMAKNQDKTVPCHRVVKSDGSIGMYNGLQGKSKMEILKKEGVRFTANGKVDITNN